MRNNASMSSAVALRVVALVIPWPLQMDLKGPVECANHWHIRWQKQAPRAWQNYEWQPSVLAAPKTQ
jgi:hypothetical protein